MRDQGRVWVDRQGKEQLGEANQKTKKRKKENEDRILYPSPSIHQSTCSLEHYNNTQKFIHLKYDDNKQ